MGEWLMEVVEVKWWDLDQREQESSEQAGK